MTKHFCDNCAAELDDRNTPSGVEMPGRLRGEANLNKAVLVEVITGIDGVWNKGELCKYCIIEAVNRLDDRPVAAN